MAVIVSAYFRIPSKATHEFYVPHIKRFLSTVRSQIVFFTTPDLLKEFTDMRPASLMPVDFVIIESISELRAFEKFGYDFWQRQCQIDPEKYHTPELAAVWY